MSIQSILFDRSHYTLQQSHEWIKHHGYKTEFHDKKVHITPNKYRYRQEAPDPNAKYRIKKISPGIEFIMKY